MHRALPVLLLTACAVPTVEPGDTDTPATVPDDLGVGFVVRTFEDTTRPTPANGRAPATDRRTLPTRVWYPSTVAPDDGDVEEAPLDTRQRWPLVVFVHGSSGTPMAYGWLGSALARAGYVVAAADFPLTSLVTPGGPSDEHVDDQPADVRFLADQVLAGGVDRVPATALVPDAYAVAGHSTGGTMALLAAFAPDVHDDRVRAVVDGSGDACFFGDAFFATRPVPLLALGGSDDLYVPAPNNVVRAYDLAQAPKVLAVLVGGTHLGFTSFDLPDDAGVTPTRPGDPLADSLAAYGGGTACEPVPARTGDPTLALQDEHDLLAAWTIAFLDAHLRDQPAALGARVADPGPLVQAQADDPAITASATP